MQPIPNEPSEEAKKLYGWAILYTLLGISFLILTVILFLNRNAYGWASIVGGFISLSKAGTRLQQADLYDRFDNDQE